MRFRRLHCRHAFDPLPVRPWNTLKGLLGHAGEFVEGHHVIRLTGRSRSVNYTAERPVAHTPSILKLHTIR